MSQIFFSMLRDLLAASDVVLAIFIFIGGPIFAVACVQDAKIAKRRREEIARTRVTPQATGPTRWPRQAWLWWTLALCYLAAVGAAWTEDLAPPLRESVTVVSKKYLVGSVHGGRRDIYRLTLAESNWWEYDVDESMYSRVKEGERLEVSARPWSKRWHKAVAMSSGEILYPPPRSWRDIVMFVSRLAGVMGCALYLVWPFWRRRTLQSPSPGTKTV